MREILLGTIALLAAGCGTSDGGDPPAAPDLDDDGYPAAEDCDDGDAAIHPGADEHCDGVDEDCDTVADNGALDAVSYFVDGDRDGFGEDSSATVGCAPENGVPEGEDCDDTDPNRFPGAPERCNDLDDDCDPTTREIAELGGLAFPGLGDAIAAAEDGDVVIACAGTHAVSGLQIVRDITVIGASSDPAATTIDADGGGAVFVVDGGALTLEFLTITHGTGLPTPILRDVRAGGAVNALLGAGGPLTVRTCVFTENYAEIGGAVVGDTITVEDSTFSDNRANLAGGAVHHLGGTTLTLLRTTFGANSADRGGAVSAEQGFVSVIDSTFDTNDAEYGGGLYLIGGLDALEATFAGTTISSNTAGWFGGGLYASNTHLELDDATVLTGNEAESEGGGAYFVGDRAGLRWTGGQVVGNRSLIGGGLQWVMGADGSVLSELTIDGNHAMIGAGMSFESMDRDGLAPTGELVDVTVTNNVSSYTGGGIDLLDATLLLERVEIRANQAERGAGLDSWDATVALSDVSVVENVASDYGGGLLLADSDLTVIDSDLGTGATDNLPDDVVLEDRFHGNPVSFSGYGAGATFSCTRSPVAVCE